MAGVGPIEELGWRGVESAWAVGPFLIGVVAISVIVTPMFNAARGSILIAALFPFQMNDPVWPGAQPWDTYVFLAVAAFVVPANAGRRSPATVR